ncbi:hypothetical protein DVA67_006085 [Solirubrobacter sp. CPCC 204708]|uniref:MFS transporter n=1 Tax=Solirubrobacter deserti TaxID=2282478 RepID=A0ABT4RCB5_9ACTN|nr:hypothetical protein [Solirubrobacter deserti]MBE2315536.1 hypothetical protein [Solirubrobacter deserti]MDA0136174.1 hypothetical protein [Solirubrobacter deserti]
MRAAYAVFAAASTAALPPHGRRTRASWPCTRPVPSSPRISRALLPAIVAPEELARANGRFGAVREIGQLAGPAAAAGLLLVADPSTLLAFNALTFALSALLLTRLRGKLNPPAPAEDERTTSLRPREVRAWAASGS